MSDMSDLERRYRRLLALYPESFRRQHEQEILAVLMSGAGQGQTWPRPAESLDLGVNALIWRLRHTRMSTSWEYRHATVMAPIRVAIGLWLLVLTALLYGYGHGGWWAALLVPAALLHFFLAHRLRHPPDAHEPPTRQH